MTPPALTLELLYETPVVPDAAAVIDHVRRTLTSSRLEGEGMVVHEQFAKVIADGTNVPLATHVTPSPELRVIEREHDFSQTWGWPEARERVDRATACVAVVEMMGHLHEPADRLTAFRAVVDALVGTTEPLALWCPNISKFVPPEHTEELEAFLNVRLFQVEDGDGTMVMDSLGLHAFGLPDVQCHFRGLDPGQVASLLYDAAAYVLERGDIIEDGNTVPGVGGEGRWRCRHEAALVGPERMVVDIEPAAPHAARRRGALERARYFKRRR